jgi:peptidoglycan/xylan/chitin deacetylase (PgdA/CDA1 family)
VTQVRTIPILLYHSISDDLQPEIAPWTVSPRDFQDHVAAMVDSGRTPLRISDLAAALRGERALPEQPMAVTFDDGYGDTIEAVQRLAGAGIPATVYVTTGTLGERGMVSIQSLFDLCHLGDAVEVGAHSVSHRRLDELDGAELVEETAGSRVRIEEVTQRACTSFAYPHGNHDAASIAAVRAAGYSSAVAVRNALSHEHDNVFALARVTMERGTTAATVCEVLAGRFKIAAPTEPLRTRGYRQVRRLRRRLRRPEQPASR